MDAPDLPPGSVPGAELEWSRSDQDEVVPWMLVRVGRVLEQELWRRLHEVGLTPHLFSEGFPTS